MRLPRSSTRRCARPDTAPASLAAAVRAAALASLLPGLASAGAAASAPDSDAVRVRDILADPRFQSRLTDPAFDWGSLLSKGWLTLPFLHLRVPIWVPYVALAVLVLVVALAVARRLSRGSEPVSAAGPANAATAQSPRSLARALELGDAGRYLEAVHMLLLVALDQWAAVSRRNVGSDQTSREVLRTLPASLPEERREALATLIRTVEWSWFGGRPVERSDYELSLRCCREFLGLEA